MARMQVAVRSRRSDAQVSGSRRLHSPIYARRGNPDTIAAIDQLRMEIGPSLRTSPQTAISAPSRPVPRATDDYLN